MYYHQLPEDKYIYYECFINKKGRLIYIVNNNPFDNKLFVYSKSIPVSRYIPSCFHGLVLRYYYDDEE
jgi:hypothetical protein